MAEIIRMTLAQQQNYQFNNHFPDNDRQLVIDLPPPLGQGEGLSPEQLLLAAVANCYAASMVFAMRKYHDRESTVRGEAECEVERNEKGQLRVTSLTVSIQLGLPAAKYEKLGIVLERFEDYCIVSHSVAAGIPMLVNVYDGDEQLLKSGQLRG
jgi:organic hydroperoxide reductase OsmC/OhrA